MKFIWIYAFSFRALCNILKERRCGGAEDVRTVVIYCYITCL